jgi:hypothetical protein
LTGDFRRFRGQLILCIHFPPHDSTFLYFFCFFFVAIVRIFHVFPDFLGIFPMGAPNVGKQQNSAAKFTIWVQFCGTWVPSFGTQNDRAGAPSVHRGAPMATLFTMPFITTNLAGSNPLHGADDALGCILYVHLLV